MTKLKAQNSSSQKSERIAIIFFLGTTLKSLETFFDIARQSYVTESFESMQFMVAIKNYLMDIKMPNNDFHFPSNVFIPNSHFFGAYSSVRKMRQMFQQHAIADESSLMKPDGCLAVYWCLKIV